MPQDFFTIADVAKKLQLHAKTVLNFVHEGQLKALRIGKQYRIAPDDLSAFMRTATPTTPSSEPGDGRYIESSAVLTIDGISEAQADRLTTYLKRACTAQNARDPHAHVDAIHNGELSRLKLIVSGSLETSAYLQGLVPTFLAC